MKWDTKLRKNKLFNKKIARSLWFLQAGDELLFFVKKLKKGCIHYKIFV